MSFSRRRFLASITAGGTAMVGLPFLEMFDASRARAQSGAPLRFLMIHSPQGWTLEKWMSNWSSGTIQSGNLGAHLESLDRHRQDLIIMRGLQSHVNYHTGNMAGFSTGDGLTSSEGYAKSISIDQAIANRIGGDTRYKSLHFGADTTSDRRGRNSLVFPGPNQVIHPVGDPSAMFDKIFAGVEPNMDDSELAMRVDRQTSVLDSLLDQLSSLHTQAGPDDRRRLDAHLTSVREIEQSIMSDASAGGCAPPTDAAFNAAMQNYRNDQDSWVRQPENIENVLQHQMKLIGKAFQCDTTRVASLQILREGMSQTAVWLQDRYPGIQGASLHDHKHEGNEFAQGYETWALEQFALLLDELQAEDVDGRRIIDNTIIFFGSGLPKGAHSVPGADLGVILAGGGDDFLKTGQVVNVRNDALNDSYGEGEKRRDPNSGVVYLNRLHLTLLRAFGINDSSFGSAAHSAGGPLDDGLLA
jgi:hypothetical protein